jgi:hypothetical protein
MAVLPLMAENACGWIRSAGTLFSFASAPAEMTACMFAVSVASTTLGSEYWYS